MDGELNSLTLHDEKVLSDIITIACRIYRNFPDEKDQDYAKTVFQAAMAVLFPEFRQ